MDGQVGMHYQKVREESEICTGFLHADNDLID
jgi:hypothetical protein